MSWSRLFNRTPAATPNDTPAPSSQETIIKASWFDQQLAISGEYTLVEVEKEVEAVIVWLRKKIEEAATAHTLYNEFRGAFYLKERAGLTKAAGQAMVNRLNARVPECLSISIIDKKAESKYGEDEWYVFVRYTASKAEQIQRPSLFGRF